MRLAGTVRLDVAEIADMAWSCIMPGMRRFAWVEMTAGKLFRRAMNNRRTRECEIRVCRE